MASRAKGDGKGKTGGRKAGIPNKTTKEMRELIMKFTVEQFPQFIKDWKEIKKPELKVDLYLKAAKFVIPQLTSVELTGDEQPKGFKDELHEMAEELDKK